MKTYSVTSTEKLRELCIKNEWFTCGTNAQYDKLFQENKNESPIEEIALIIWLCSDEHFTRGEIISELLKAREDFWNAFFGVHLSSMSLLRFHHASGKVWECGYREFLDAFCDPQNEEWTLDVLTRIDRANVDDNLPVVHVSYSQVWKNHSIIYAEWTSYMHAYRLYAVDTPHETIAYVKDLEDERAKRPELRIIEVDADTMHKEVY